MNRIFVDTWAWYALVDTRDHHHLVAQLANEALLDQEYTFVTTNFVLAETLTLIRYNIGHTTAVQFRKQLQHFITAALLEYVTVIDGVTLSGRWACRGWLHQRQPVATAPRSVTRSAAGQGTNPLQGNVTDIHNYH